MLVLDVFFGSPLGGSIKLPRSPEKEALLGGFIWFSSRFLNWDYLYHLPFFLAWRFLVCEFFRGPKSMDNLFSLDPHTVLKTSPSATIYLMIKIWLLDSVEVLHVRYGLRLFIPIELS